MRLYRVKFFIATPLAFCVHIGYTYVTKSGAAAMSSPAVTIRPRDYAAEITAEREAHAFHQKGYADLCAHIATLARNAIAMPTTTVLQRAKLEALAALAGIDFHTPALTTTPGDFELMARNVGDLALAIDPMVLTIGEVADDYNSSSHKLALAINWTGMADCFLGNAIADLTTVAERMREPW